MSRDITDSHFHSLEMLRKGLNPVAVLANAAQTGFAGAVDIGLHPGDLDDRIGLFADVENVWFSSGLATAAAGNDAWKEDIVLLKEQAFSGRIIAIGELGLDYHWNYGTPASQMELMNAQLLVARDAGLPVIVHNRDADQDVYDLLKTAALPAGGIMHCFSSNYEYAAACVDLGFMISFAGNVTYKKSDIIQDAAARLPAESILVETDSPYLSPVPLRGKPNTPENIHYTYEFIAALRNIPAADLASQVKRNFYSIFKFTDRG